MKKCKFFRINAVFLIALFCFSLAGCSKSHAIRESGNRFESTVRESETIVLASCTGNEVVKAENGMVFTVTSFRVEEVVKGDMKEESFSVRLPGGKADGIKVKLTDRPEFVEREDVVLFLEGKNEDGFYIPESFANGIYRVHYDDSDIRYVKSPPGGMTIYKNSGREELGEGDDTKLEDFIYTIKKVSGQEIFVE